MTTSARPGYRQVDSVTPYTVMRQEARDLFYSLGITVDKDNSFDGDGGGSTFKRLRGGVLMGKITTSGLWVPCKRTAVNETGATADNFIVDEAHMFGIGDVISVDSDTGLTILTIDYATKTITVDSSITFADDDAVFIEDGSDRARGILMDDEVDLLDEQSVLTNRDGRLAINGFVDESLVRGDLVAALADTNHRLGNFIFDDTQLTS